MNKWTNVSAFALALGLLAGACGNGDESATDGGDGASELTSLASAWGEADVRASYDWRISTEEDSQQGSMDLFWQSTPSAWRLDVTEETLGTTTLLNDGASTIVCDASEESCFRVTGQQLQIPFLFLDDAVQRPATFGASITQQFSGAELDTADREVAGRAATCFATEVEDASAEVCLGDDGLVLASMIEGPQGSQSYEATEVGSDIADGDLEAPFEVQEIEQVPAPGEEQPGS